MSFDNIAIRVRGVSKCYQIYAAPHDRLKQSIYPRLQRLTGRKPVTYYNEFWALKDVSFEVQKGQAVGILGKNGSGKSTLLQIICGTIPPTQGMVETFGRVAALLELGAGFSPEFTGRENVYTNAGVLGLRRDEVDAQFDKIVRFAEVGDFLDQPVKTYSSGMFVRLAFAVIAHVNADILVIDEALAVGDIFFQQKCMRFLRTFLEKGGTLLFVSHDTSSIINMCRSAVLLFPGGCQPPVTDEAAQVCKLYLANYYADSERTNLISQMAKQLSGGEAREHVQVFEGDPQTDNIFAISPFRRDAESFGEGGARIVDVFFRDDEGARASFVKGGHAVQMVVQIEVAKHIHWPAVGFMLKDRLGQYLFTEGTDVPFRRHQMVLEPDQVIEAIFRFTMPVLIQGHYTMNVAVAEGLGDSHFQHHWIHDAILLESLTSRIVHGIGGVADLEISVHVSSQRVVNQS